MRAAVVPLWKNTGIPGMEPIPDPCLRVEVADTPHRSQSGAPRRPACAQNSNSPAMNAPVRTVSVFLKSLGWLALSAAVCAQSPTELIDAIRDADGPRIQRSLQNPDQRQARDTRGNTALHWAALAGDATTVDQLLAAGIDPRATNHSGATPLHYGTANDRIVRALLKAGADPLAKSLNGATPLQTAAAKPQGYRSVRRLLDAGADPNTPRSLFPAGVNVPISDPAFGEIRPLALAIYYGDPRSAKLLLERGASPKGTKGMTPVATAAFTGRGDWVRELVQHGGEVNFDEGFVGHAFNNLMYGGHRRSAAYVLDHGADLHQVTSIGEKTPPMVWSAYSENGDPLPAKALLAKGVDINEPTLAGHTALDWAEKRGETPLVSFLRTQGATHGTPTAKPWSPPSNSVPTTVDGRAAAVRDAVNRSVPILQHTSDQFLANGFVQQSGCVSCHHQTLPAVAFGRARERGFAVDEAALARQLQRQYESWSKGRDGAYEMFEPQPDSPANLGYGLFGLQSLGYAPDDLTEALVWFLAQSQLEDGSFPAFDRRPPLEEGQVIGTAMAVGALRRYPQPLKQVDLDRTFARARQWLTRVEPEDPNQELFRLLGLGWAGASPSELRPYVKQILSKQNTDGGWSPLPRLGSDAYATGTTLFVLHEVGGLSTTDPRYLRGADYLLRTQFADGSWRVASRTWPLQPHFDSGFPHGRDQWTSAAGTAWATIALLNLIEPSVPRTSLGSAQELMSRHPVASQGTNASSTDGGVAHLDEGIFKRDILPIFQRSCVPCHGGDAAKGGLNVETVTALLKGGQSGEGSVVPGNPAASPLLRFVQDQVDDLEMPPLSKRTKYPPLTQIEVATLRSWIAAGSAGSQGR